MKSSAIANPVREETRANARSMYILVALIFTNVSSFVIGFSMSRRDNKFLLAEESAGERAQAPAESPASPSLSHVPDAEESYWTVVLSSYELKYRDTAENWYFKLQGDPDYPNLSIVRDMSLDGANIFLTAGRFQTMSDAEQSDVLKNARESSDFRGVGVRRIQQQKTINLTPRN
ncbi:MAG: hypothetical protein NUW37_11720 [Planctomycetes bacterium]|nr:hypothetical protein [Planctomycetota bacterium]